ncbi:MAG: hypothetical protein ABIH70_07830, partial [Chloroflexota bacterium]
GNNPDVLVLLCGCPRMCLNKEELRSRAKKVIVTAGERVGWQAVKEKDLPKVIIEAIREK